MKSNQQNRPGVHRGTPSGSDSVGANWGFGDAPDGKRSVVLGGARALAISVAFFMASVSVGVPGIATARPSADDRDADGEEIVQVVAAPERLILVAEGVWSSAEPVTDAHFDALYARGVRVIVSVDGARPRVEQANAAGLKYVHLPFGYDDVPRAVELGIVRVLEEASGRGDILFHCHHGKHRGPAAAAMACVASGRFDAAEAAKFMEAAGTSPHYRGLWKAVANYRSPGDDEELPELQPIAELPTVTVRMADLSRRLDTLNAILGSREMAMKDWETGTHAALLIEEQLTELPRELPKHAVGDLIAGYKRAQSAASRLRKELQQRQHLSAVKQLRSLQAQCAQCHAKHRN